ncbi:MAG: M1 family metallopeptidase [Bacteroidia bacterium]
MKKAIFTFFNFCVLLNLNAQLLDNKKVFTLADTLRGSLGPGRTWWDVIHYDIHARFNYNDSSVTGYNIITYKVIKPQTYMQIDLQKPLLCDSAAFISSSGKREQIHLITAKREGNVLFFNELPKQEINSTNQFIVYYHGKPRVAKHPPWDGGLILKKDKNNNPWISIACQGLGASVWYPCKDHQSDEPDSAALHITCPDTLVAVGNGRLRSRIQNKDKTATYNWAVTSPINSYCIIPYIGKYVHFGEVYQGEAGNLDMDYWVLEENLEKAKNQFKDAPKMMKALEYWFGPYPFYKDSYKLVDAPHLGMEHQSATAYGNFYQNGYLGRDLSGTGWGLKWDFIIVHESGHEWFANNITTNDIADMWVHEGFTNYSETLFTEYYWGKDAGNAYCRGIRKGIANDKPITGPYGVNEEGSGDMYYKAANMIHMIRQIINDDEKFRMILRGLNKTFYHKTVTAKEVENYIDTESKKDFTKVYEQYLTTTKIPVFEYKIKKGVLTYKWSNCVSGFNMPLKVTLEKDVYTFIYPIETPQKIKVKVAPVDFKVDDNFYVKTEKIK